MIPHMISSLSVEIILVVNKNHSLNSGHDLYTHHKITRMI